MARHSKTGSGPDFTHEARLSMAGHARIAGVDEVGRGPLAGPVVAAAVMLFHDAASQSWWRDVRLDDSKAMTEKRRATAYEAVMAQAQAVAICSLSPPSIDALNIRAASLHAMRTAIQSLNVTPDAVLIDGRDVPPGLDPAMATQTLIGGDGLSVSIAAASVVAKVTRDRMMDVLCPHHAPYGLSSHKGYGSSAHREAIAVHGGVPRLHRYSFRPLRTD